MDEEVEIIVRAKLHSIQHITVASGVGSGGAYVKSKVLNFGVDPEPILISDNSTQTAARTTATAISAIASSIEAILAAAEAAGAPIPKGEKTRLVGLVESLHIASAGLKTGAIDQSSAHKMVAGAFAVAWDVGGAAVVGITMTALAAAAGALFPLAPPHIKALAALGAGAMGLAIETAVGSTEFYEMLGKATADAIFWSGSKVADVGEALSDLLSKIVSATTSALNPFNQDPYRDLDLSFFDPVPGQDDVDGVAIEFVNYAVFETAAPATVTVQTLFYSSGGGPRLVNDEPIAGLVAAPRGSEPEVLIVDQPIG